MIANNKGLGRGLDAILSDFKEEDILKEEQQKKNSSKNLLRKNFVEQYSTSVALKTIYRSKYV